MRSSRFASKAWLFAALLIAQASIKAQVVNNGGSIKIESGGQLKCTGSLTNTTGAITNDGRIEVQGNFTNNGTYLSPGNKDSLVMSGTGNATLNAGDAGFHFLTINKVSATDVVTLGSSLLVKTKLDYLSGLLTTDYANHPSYVLTAPATAVFNIAPGREIVGTVKRTGWANGSSVLFNSSQMQIATNGGTAPADITVTMLPQDFGGDPSQAEREVKRKFLLAQNGGNGFTADVRFPYSTNELNNNAEGNLAPWYLNASEWNAVLSTSSRDVANKSVSATGIPAASLAQEWKLADPKYTFNVVAHLRSAWNGTSMNTSLNAVLPLSQPYNTAPFNYAGAEAVTTIPSANIVDWVLVELRKPSTGLPGDATSATIIGRKAGFLLKDGTVVDLDGTTPIQFDINKQGNSFLLVRHRNHLGVMSNIVPSNATGTFANDFSLLANVHARGTISNAPLQALPGSTRYGLWAGDANKDGVVNASDIGLIKSQANAVLSGYLFGDVNFDSTVNASDVGLSKVSANAAASSHSLRSATVTTTTSHIPVN
jgi:hypothetical protein